jgi:uncharacterized membrane protein YphA (DoxX/SURF4 family)
MQNKMPAGFIFVFVLLFMLTVPFPHRYIPDIAGYLHPFFEGLVKWTGGHILHLKHTYTSQLVSDSTGLYIHVFNLFIISLLTAFIWAIARKKENDHATIFFYWFRFIVSYYLALQLFEYGFNKLFKWQFYLPEPNNLYTTMGNTPRDLLYWSTMGLSRPYTIFTGVAEIIAASLLLFNRTRLAGALLGFFLLCNIVAINFSYDISVKVYSCFLLLLCVILISPDAGRLFSFFTGKKINEKKQGVVISSRQTKWIYPVIKVFVIAYILFSTLSVYFIENNFNDDMAARPTFHGAYEVTSFVKNRDTMASLLTDSSRWKRVFVHRRGYFIVQDMNDNTQDYALLTDTVNRYFILEREDDMQQFKLYYIQNPDSTLSLDGTFGKDSLSVRLRPLRLQQLPALQHEFNWTTDP